MAVGALRVSEKQWAQQVVSLARVLGWRCYRTWISIRSEPGFPDLVLARPPEPHRPGRLVFAELKTDDPRSHLSEQQVAWLRLFRQIGQEAYCWRPRDGQAVADILALDHPPYPLPEL